MKSNVVLQYQGREKSEEEMIQIAQQIWKENGHKASDLKKLALYAKPEESKVYLVINDEFAADFDI